MEEHLTKLLALHYPGLITRLHPDDAHQIFESPCKLLGIYVAPCQENFTAACSPARQCDAS